MKANEIEKLLLEVKKAGRKDHEGYKISGRKAQFNLAEGAVRKDNWIRLLKPFSIRLHKN